MSTSNTSIEYYKQQYCTLFIGLLTADVTISQGNLVVKLVKFSVLACQYILPETDWLVSLDFIRQEEHTGIYMRKGLHIKTAILDRNFQ